MSMNKSNILACIPANIYCEYTHDRYQDEGLRLLEKYLPYLNPETGLRNRMITRDPVTGLGDLEAEWNPLNGCHLRRRHFPHRDPIRMEGDMGTEYNCLYTTKELTCKDRVNRDPITLQGDLGEELDMFRPHGGRPRNKIDHNIHVSRSDSISGRCEYNVENNSVNQYNERQCNEENSKRYSYLATDPITHSLPETKLVRSQSVRHYKEAWATHDPIGYMHRTGTSYKTDKVRGMKHFPINKNSGDPVTHRLSINHHRQQHRPKPTCTASISKFNTLRANTNPITHQQKNISSDQSPIGLNDETSTIGDFNEATIGNVSVVSENRKLRRALRNPITGEGMCDSDYIDLLKLPSEYYFRRNRDTLSSTLNIHSHSPPVQPASTTTPSTNTAVAVKKVPVQKDANPTSKLTASKPRHQTPPPAPPPQQPRLEPKVEKSTPQPIEKKVIRPKKIEVPTEKQPVKENKQPVSVTQSQPITETQASTKEAEPQTPKAVAEPQTLETEKQQTPKEAAKPKTPKTEKPEIPRETVKPQTPETKEPQTLKEATNLQTLDEIPQTAKEVAKPQTPKLEEIKTPTPQIPEETVELHTPVETPITPTSHTLAESTVETKSTGKLIPQPLSEELKLAIDESEPPQPATFSVNDKIPEVSEDLRSPAVQSPPISEARLSVDNKMPRLLDSQTSKDDLTPKPSTELPETGQV
ncbi:unnamed protein product [Schistosoma spindalis]|nr:unnamed protein product [Schistosoma spindale]